MSASDSAPTSLQFTEEMKGFITFGETDYQKGFEQGEKNNTACMFHLTITIADVKTFVADPQHEGSSEGYVSCDRLGGQRTVGSGDGIFNLFVDTADPKRKLMLYRLFFTDAQGEPITLSGFKDIKDDSALNIWHDTTTLYTKILRGRVPADQEPAAEVLAAGIITIHQADFLKQLTTFRVKGPTSGAEAEAALMFGQLFLGSLWDVYGLKFGTA